MQIQESATLRRLITNLKPGITIIPCHSKIKVVKRKLSFQNAFRIWKIRVKILPSNEVLLQKPPLIWGIKRCDLCLKEKLPIAKAYPDILLNKRPDIVWKCRHCNKFTLKRFRQFFNARNFYKKSKYCHLIAWDFQYKKQKKYIVFLFIFDKELLFRFGKILWFYFVISFNGFCIFPLLFF